MILCACLSIKLNLLRSLLVMSKSVVSCSKCSRLSRFSKAYLVSSVDSFKSYSALLFVLVAARVNLLLVLRVALAGTTM